MYLIHVFALLVASCTANPLTSEKLVVTKECFSDEFVLYTGKHDIVKIFAPLNQFSYDDEAFGNVASGLTDPVHTLFFVEADIEDGKRTDQGLYVSNNHQVKKLLDNGRDAVTTRDNVTYFGAKDGIYKYDETEIKAVKHGAVTDNIVQLAFNKKTNDIYYLTEGNEVFKLNSDASASVKIEKVKKAKHIVFGFEGNLYYLDSDKNVYILDTESESSVPKKVELPTGYNTVILTQPMNGINENGVLLTVDDDLYFLNANGKLQTTVMKLAVKPTAYETQPTIIQFFALDKKIYKYNILYIVYHDIIPGVKAFMESNRPLSSLL